MPYAAAILGGTPVGSFNSYSNEDHWVDDPTTAGIVLIGDAAGHNDPVTGQGLSIAARDVRMVSDILIQPRIGIELISRRTLTSGEKECVV